MSYGLDYGEFGGGGILQIPIATSTLTNANKSENVVIRSAIADNYNDAPPASPPRAARAHQRPIPANDNADDDNVDQHSNARQAIRNGHRNNNEDDEYDELMRPPPPPSSPAHHQQTTTTTTKRRKRTDDDDADEDVDDKRLDTTLMQIEASYERIDEFLRDALSEIDRLNRYVKQLKRHRTN